MKVMVFAKATEATESGVPPTPEAMKEMDRYTQALIAAGILKDMVFGGLQPTRFAKRVRFSGKNRSVVDGPFTETKEVVVGFMLWEVTSIEQAVEWVKKSPNNAQTDAEVEIRPLFSMEAIESWENPKPQ
jgi:hypothetical protein